MVHEFTHTHCMHVFHLYVTCIYIFFASNPYFHSKVCKNGEPEIIAKLVAKPHKPKNSTEKVHIESLGGKNAVDKKRVT